jgi:hypothetical protein
MPIRELSCCFWGVPTARGAVRSALLGLYRRSVFPTESAPALFLALSQSPRLRRPVPLPSWLDTKENAAWVCGA